MIIGSKNVETPIIDILNIAKNQIKKEQGRVVLRDIKDIGNNIMITCPFHKNGEERKPSCGVNNIDKKDAKKGIVHCFTCGKTVSFEFLISYIFNINDHGEFGKKWLLDNFKSNLNRDIKIEISRGNNSSKNNFIKENILQQYRFYHPYMYKRGLTNDIINKYDIGYDRNNKHITFPVRDKKGNCLFVGRRSIESKFFVLPQDLIKPIYGIYELDYSKSSLYICESFFNTLTLAKWGYNAIALMGTGTPNQYEIINSLPFRSIYLCLDGDNAGDLGCQKLEKFISKNKNVYRYIIPRGKDVNDLERGEFNELKILKRID